jgi:hypothetical protein
VVRPATHYAAKTITEREPLPSRIYTGTTSLSPGGVAVSYDHGYDGQLLPRAGSGPLLRRGCLERIGEDTPEEERLFLDLRKDETQHDVVLESLKADCEVRTGLPAASFPPEAPRSLSERLPAPLYLVRRVRGSPSLQREKARM